MKIWSPVSVNMLHRRHWEGDDVAVVYNAASGDTHLLELPALEILDRIRRSPCTSQELANELADNFPAGEQDQALAYVEATLIQLQDVGLVISSQFEDFGTSRR